MTTMLILGSGPDVTDARRWDATSFDHILAINNAHAVRADWDSLIHPWDFPPERRPQPVGNQRIVTQEDFVPAQNAYGGFVYAGGTMAFTASYWALYTHRPTAIGFAGCDMHYPVGAPTHFYGNGSPDPLRADITLQSLEAKSARLLIIAAMQNCALINLSQGPSRLVFPRGGPGDLRRARPQKFDETLARLALRQEATLGYSVASGRYWEEADRFDPAALRELDQIWLSAAGWHDSQTVAQGA